MALQIDGKGRMALQLEFRGAQLRRWRRLVTTVSTLGVAGVCFSLMREREVSVMEAAAAAPIVSKRAVK